MVAFHCLFSVSILLVSYIGEGYGDLYKAPKRNKKGNERFRGEGGQMKFIGLRSERWQVVGFWEGSRQDVL